MNIYELTGEWLKLYSMADDEIDDEIWKDTLEAIEGEIEVKAENTAKVIKQLLSDANGIKAEADRLSARAKSLENRAEWLKKNLENTMNILEKKEIKTDLFTFKIQQNGGKLPLIISEEISVEDVPAEFLKYPEPQLNNEAIRTALDDGIELDFARYGERGQSLRIK